MSEPIFQRVTLNDSNESVVSKYSECKQGLSLRDMYPGFAAKRYNEKTQKLHDANFAFVMTKLSKIHNKVYEPKHNVTYAQDVPIDVGGGMVDYVDHFSVEWIGMPTENQALTGNNVNTLQRVNAKLNHKAVNVYNFEMAYDIKFIEIDKLNKVAFQKALEAIYKDGIMAGWDMFCDKIAYLGVNGNDGLLNNANVITTVLPLGTADKTQKGFQAMTDQEVVSVINGILSYYLINTNNNLDLLPDVFLLPMTDASELSQRYSSLYTSTLRQFLMNFNVGVDEAVAAGYDNYKIKLRGRARLNDMGQDGAGRIVAYKFDKDYVRMDVPYPVQVYYTAPNIERACYTTIFVGQVSEVQLPYNTSNSEIGAVTYWDFTKPEKGEDGP